MKDAISIFRLRHTFRRIVLGSGDAGLRHYVGASRHHPTS